jgi:hypothetical protein
MGFRIQGGGRVPRQISQRGPATLGAVGRKIEIGLQALADGGRGKSQDNRSEQADNNFFHRFFKWVWLQN